MEFLRKDKGKMGNDAYNMNQKGLSVEKPFSPSISTASSIAYFLSISPSNLPRFLRGLRELLSNFE